MGSSIEYETQAPRPTDIDNEGVNAARAGKIVGAHAGNDCSLDMPLSAVAVHAHEVGSSDPHNEAYASKDEFIVAATMEAFRVRRVRRAKDPREGGQV